MSTLFTSVNENNLQCSYIKIKNYVTRPHLKMLRLAGCVNSATLSEYFSFKNSRLIFMLNTKNIENFAL